MHLKSDEQEKLLLVVYIQLKHKLTMKSVYRFVLQTLQLVLYCDICSYRDINLGDI